LTNHIRKRNAILNCNWPICGWPPFGHESIGHEPLTALEQVKAGIGCCEWLWSIGAMVKRDVPAGVSFYLYCSLDVNKNRMTS